jgi:hypothetical protein
MHAKKSEADPVVPIAELETEGIVRERAIVGLPYHLSFVLGGLRHECVTVFLDVDGAVLSAGMDERGLIAPAGARWVEHFKWLRKSA